MTERHVDPARPLPDRPEDAEVGWPRREGFEGGPGDGFGDEFDGAPVGRRIFLGLVALGSLGIVTGAALQRWVTDTLSGSPFGGFVPSGDRFRIYTVTGGFPYRSRDEYQLRVSGLVERELTLSYADLLAMEPTTLVRDFQCVTGWRVDDVEWTGVALGAVLDRAGVKPRGTALRFWSFDGAYTESLTIEQARRDDVLVAYRMLGDEISRAHGGPVRLYVVPMYGYKSIKWLDTIEVVDDVIPGYWEERGYAIDAWVGSSNDGVGEPTA